MVDWKFDPVEPKPLSRVEMIPGANLHKGGGRLWRFQHVVEKHGPGLVGARPGERIPDQPLRAIRGGTLCLRRRRQWERIEGDVLFSSPGRQMVHLSSRSRAACHAG
ncbi:hypothetical protein BUPH_08452 (plasmid) [Paraburkholderia phenoliruptrix BR3459a]|uniref:Uncharacterized protein n=1 Tax=Paraburkholderia phenoliruptrix BR3459a TaxID=1229205 RepID=K0DZM5_9BURK|nr:hypothetical protein BUPH_08452 [Paraburkholderia phenoliruptrix BR3459a]